MAAPANDGDSTEAALAGERAGAPRRAAESAESRYQEIFQKARVVLWEQDFSDVLDMLDDLRSEGVADIRNFFQKNPDRLAEAIGRVRIIDVNDFAVEFYEARHKQELLQSLHKVFLPETEIVFIEELVALFAGRRRAGGESAVPTLKGGRRDVVFTVAFEGERCERTLVSLLDVSALKAAERAAREQTRRAETLNEISKTISSDLDLESVVQKVTDAATELSGARFGAFFYNTVNADGEALMLYTLSGAPREAFEKFGLPRVTPIFEPTFRGAGVVRSDDIRADPRYGRNAPHRGMPEGHLPVVSYLAVPVISRSGEVLGGLFFGHDEPGVFTLASEALVSGIAAHAAIAIDNARLLRTAQAEVERRREAEGAKALLLSEMSHRVKNTLSTVQAIAAQTFHYADHQTRDAFASRLRALGAAQDVLSGQDWERAPVGEIVRRAVAPFDANKRFDIAGDQTWLDARKAMVLSMALHELSTNAVKYGALSNGEGRVSVSWMSDAGAGAPILKLIWREGGGPPAAEPQSRGFGSFLIERTIQGAGGKSDLVFNREGVSCSLEIPL